jgi:hypothetical protein
MHPTWEWCNMDIIWQKERVELELGILGKSVTQILIKITKIFWSKQSCTIDKGSSTLHGLKRIFFHNKFTLHGLKSGVTRNTTNQ